MVLEYHQVVIQVNEPVLSRPSVYKVSDVFVVEVWTPPEVWIL